ncbi:polysaccharide biosynthesis/export family protein [Sneathiella aquimaris]|uniref:polysaccharide biosynthesis/export family protein n=1 Tax=Sneathiella aquimaris TaxID=2599305 RepID=UPI00146AFED1|nr:polysaccharide biosynthesis/export family protein [Sneathiella aquimaris]
MRHLILNLTIMTFVLCTGLALGKSGVAAEYTLDTGDVLSIKLLERNEISGDVIVGMDGTISLPGIGAIVARGETVRGLERKLLKRISETVVQPSLAVQMVAYRPFFILGEVGEAGGYPYQPGLTVLKAVSLAKGFKSTRSDLNQFSKQLANLRAKQALGNNVTTLASAEVRRARVLAEQADQDIFAFDPGSGIISKLPNLDTIIETEQALFAKRRVSHKRQLDQVKETIAARQLELQSYKKRMSSKDDLNDQIDKEVREVRKLRKQGLVPVERVNRLIREQLNIRGQVLQTNSLLRQAQVSLSLSQEKLISLTEGLKVELAREVRELEDQISILKTSIKGELEIMESTGDGYRRSAGSDQIGYGFEIHRKDQLLTGTIDFNTPILPGDTLIVLRNRPSLDTVQLYERGGG